MFVVLGRRRRARMGTQNVLFNIFYELVERYVAIRVPRPRDVGRGSWQFVPEIPN